MSATTLARPTPPVTPTTAASGRRRAALLLALRLYLRELRSHPLLATGALLCPALGNVCLGYLPPLVVAALVGALATGTSLTVQLVTPHLFAFAGALVAGSCSGGWASTASTAPTRTASSGSRSAAWTRCWPRTRTSSTRTSRAR